MGELKNYFLQNKGNLIDKWIHYFDIYEFYFSSFRNKPICLLEIGVFQGGSLQMWKNYFHSESEIFGIDFNPECKKFESDNVYIHIGSQADVSFLKEFISVTPKFDIIIDDGSHKVDHQKISFEILFDHLNEGGIYICEDTHTSYWSNYGGGFKVDSSFVEYSKNKIDDLNAWHSRSPQFKKNKFTENIKSIHFYDSMVVIMKGKVSKPISKRTGKFVIDPGSLVEPEFKKKNFLKSIFNKAIKFLKI